MTSELDRLERQAQEVRGQLALDLDELFLRLQPRRMARNIAVYARTRRPAAVWAATSSATCGVIRSPICW